MVQLKVMRDFAFVSRDFGRLEGRKMHMQVMKRRDEGRLDIMPDLSFADIEKRIVSVAASNRAKRREPYVPEGVPPVAGWQALRHGPVHHGRRWG